MALNHLRIWRRCRAATGVVLIGFVLSVTGLFAHTVQPMRFELAPSGAGAKTTMTIDNTRSFPITLEIYAHALSLDENGAEVLTPADDDFLIFPPQMLLDAGKSQSVRVQYIGAPDIATSQTYRVIVSQIPVDMSGNQDPGVAVTVNFATLANVVPVGAKPDVQITGYQAEGDALNVGLTNGGTSYARLLSSEWTLTDGAKTVTYGGTDVAAWLGDASNLMLPGLDREISIPVPDGFDATTTKISLQLL